MFEKLKEKFQDLYWLIPYDYRIENIWYRLRCRFWYKYTTIKSRELGNTYCDTVELLPYTVFEIFCRFMENEVKGPCHIDWTCHKIEHKGNQVPVDSVWWECYEWWNNVYLTEEDSSYSEWHDFLDKHRIHRSDFDSYFNPKFDTEENERIANKIFKECQEKELKRMQELEDWLILLVKTRNLMWT